MSTTVFPIGFLTCRTSLLQDFSNNYRSITRSVSTLLHTKGIAFLRYTYIPSTSTTTCLQDSNLASFKTTSEQETERHLQSHDLETSKETPFSQKEQQVIPAERITNQELSSTPALSTLASVASAPSPHLRYVIILSIRTMSLEIGTLQPAGRAKLKQMRNCAYKSRAKG